MEVGDKFAPYLNICYIKPNMRNIKYCSDISYLVLINCLIQIEHNL